MVHQKGRPRVSKDSGVGEDNGEMGDTGVGIWVRGYGCADMGIWACGYGRLRMRGYGCAAKGQASMCPGER